MRSEPFDGLPYLPIDVVAADTPDVLPGVSGRTDHVNLPGVVLKHGFAYGVGQLMTAAFECGFRASVRAQCGGEAMGRHGTSVADVRVAYNTWPNRATREWPRSCGIMKRAYGRAGARRRYGTQ